MDAFAARGTRRCLRPSDPARDGRHHRSTASIDRIGSALIAQQHGHTEVIGILHQHTTRFDGIAAAVEGVGVSVDGIGRSVGLLSSLSMVGLGFSALSQVHISCQFARLTERLKRLDDEVQEIKEMMHAEFRGELNAGLIKLNNGFEGQASGA